MKALMYVVVGMGLYVWVGTTALIVLGVAWLAIEIIG